MVVYNAVAKASCVSALSLDRRPWCWMIGNAALYRGCGVGL